jgi:hypothetical protein
MCQPCKRCTYNKGFSLRNSWWTGQSLPSICMCSSCCQVIFICAVGLYSQLEVSSWPSSQLPWISGGADMSLTNQKHWNWDHSCISCRNANLLVFFTSHTARSTMAIAEILLDFRSMFTHDDTDGPLALCWFISLCEHHNHCRIKELWYGGRHNWTSITIIIDVPTSPTASGQPLDLLFEPAHCSLRQRTAR